MTIYEELFQIYLFFIYFFFWGGGGGGRGGSKIVPFTKRIVFVLFVVGLSVFQGR